jgi:hypothetical protein
MQDWLPCPPGCPTQISPRYMDLDGVCLRPGLAHITLTVTTYDKNSQIVLSELQPIQVTIPVRATTSYRIRIREAVYSSGSGLRVLLGVIEELWRRHRRPPRNPPDGRPSGNPPAGGPSGKHGKHRKHGPRTPPDEFDAKISQAFTSRTYAELTLLTADIPAARGPNRGPTGSGLGRLSATHSERLRR